MELNELIREIRTELRLSMNGVVSQSMREKGIAYKLNFGVELPRLKELAARYGKNHELAQALWKEDVREFKILAGMLQPVDTFFPEIADIWVEDIRYPEIAELTCMNLFQYLPYAPAKAFEWMADEREYFETCGFLLAAWLFARGLELNERAEMEFFDQASAVLQSEAYQPRKAAALSLKKYGLQSSENARKVRKLIVPFRKSDRADLRAICEEMLFELE